jgi:hypothetical protein
MRSAEASLRRVVRLVTIRVVFPIVAIAAGGVIASPVGCGSNPPIKCTVESATGTNNGDAIARYTVLSVSSEEACANSGLPRTPPKPLADGGIAPESPVISENPIPWYATTATSVPLGVEAYTPNPEDPNYASELYSMAIKAEWLGVRILDAQSNANLPNYPYATADDIPAPPPNGKPGTNFPYAWGQFDSIYPDANGICHIADMASDLTYPDVPEHMGADVNGNPVDVPDQPATHVQYAWTNLRTYVSVQAEGVQAYGNVAITVDDCTINYSVAILIPRVQCGSTTDVDSNGNSLSGDQTQCDPNPDGPNNLYGSGINEFVSPVCTNVSNDPANSDFECLPPTSDDDPNSTAL